MSSGGSSGGSGSGGGGGGGGGGSDWHTSQEVLFPALAQCGEVGVCLQRFEGARSNDSVEIGPQHLHARLEDLSLIHI